MTYFFNLFDNISRVLLSVDQRDYDGTKPLNVGDSDNCMTKLSEIFSDNQNRTKADFKRATFKKQGLPPYPGDTGGDLEVRYAFESI